METMGRKKSSGVPTITARQIAYCLKHLHDGTALRQSPLIKLPMVARLASERYRGSFWGYSYALRDVVLDACAALEAGMDGDPGVRRVVTFLRLYTHETSVSEIARTLAVNRTTIYRFILPNACSLLAEEIQREGAQHATHGIAATR
jgi:hypothetical protein